MALGCALTTFESETIPCVAAQYGDAMCAHLLLRHGADLSAVDENGDLVVADRPMLARITHVALTTMLMKTAATQVYVVYANWGEDD